MAYQGLAIECDDFQIGFHDVGWIWETQEITEYQW